MAKIRSMEEFASASGISRPTLSKYFSDPGSVRGTTRHRIEEALTRFDYRPNIFAINQNRRRPRTVGILVPYLTDPFFAELVRQLEARCLAMGIWAIVLSSHANPEFERKAIDTLLSLRLSGAIVAPLGSDLNHGSYEALNDAIPIVLLDSWIDLGVPFVGTDNADSIGLLVEYLVRTGEPPCYLDLPDVTRNASDRRVAFAAAAAKAGFDPHVLSIDADGWDFEQLGFDVVAAHLAGSGLPSRTLLCANDRLAFGALSAACKAGLRIGRGEGTDIRIAGHDDHPLSRFTCPSLTTMAQDFGGLAGAAFDALLERLGDAVTVARSKLLPAKLVMRDSA